MSKNYFQISENTKKLKFKLITASSIALFVGLTDKMPTKITWLGLDLSNAGNPAILTWFIFGATAFLFFNYGVMTAMEVWRDYCIPLRIKSKCKNLTGDTIGLNSEECAMHQEECAGSPLEEQRGTVESELRDIQRKHTEISSKVQKNYLNLHSVVNIIFDIVIPLIFAIASLCCLYQTIYQQ